MDVNWYSQHMFEMGATGLKFVEMNEGIFMIHVIEEAQFFQLENLLFFYIFVGILFIY